MRRDRPNIVRKTALAAWQRLSRPTYRPEEHYMRGPGPKTLSKIGEMFRAETDGMMQEPLPNGWLDLLQSLECQQPTKSSGRGGR